MSNDPSTLRQKLRPIVAISVTSCIANCAVASVLATAIDRLGGCPRLTGKLSASVVVAPTKRRAAHARAFDQPGGDEADQIVPFEIERADVIGLELEPASIQTDDL